MSYINNNASTYGSSSYGVNNLTSSFNNLGFQPAGGSSYSSIPVPPPLPQNTLYQGNSNSFLNGRNLYTREWSQLSQYSSLPTTTSYTTSTVYPTTSTLLSAPVAAAPIIAAPAAGNMLPAPINDGRRYARLTGQKRGSRRSRRHLVQPLNGTGLQTLPAGVPVEGLAAASQAQLAGTNNMLPAPINDGRRYARLTGQKAGSNRSRRHLVQPLNGTGLQTLPAGVPVEGLAAASAAGLAGGRRSRRNNARGLNNANLNSSAGFPGTSNYISLGAAPSSSGSVLPLATSSLASSGSALPIQQQQQQFVSAPISSTIVSAPATTSFVSAPVVSAPIIAAAPAAGNMLPAPINDGRRYARLTGQKAGSRRSRRHLVQPLNGTGLQTLPAGVPVEGLAAASALGNSGRRSRRMASRSAMINNNNMMNNSLLSAAPLATTSVIAPAGTSVLPQPHLAQIPLSAPKQQMYTAPAPLIGGATF